MTIEISEKTAEILTNQAAAQGRSVGEIVEELASNLQTAEARRARQRAAFEEMRQIRERVTPDPNGQTSRDYIAEGRR